MLVSPRNCGLTYTRIGRNAVHFGETRRVGSTPSPTSTVRGSLASHISLNNITRCYISQLFAAKKFCPSLSLFKGACNCSYQRRRIGVTIPYRRFAQKFNNNNNNNKQYSTTPKVSVQRAVKDGHITITEAEQKLFTFLLDVLKCYKLNTTLRVAGGWVRDKLLNLDSVDIDIAVDNMSGTRLANFIHQYIQEHGIDTQTPSDNDPFDLDAYKIGVTKLNPEKSKHLETAIVDLFGFEVNLVQLRTDEYSRSSRIPKVKVGTPEEDAYRRDLTINSLFYNINADAIEDFTGKGLEHMKEKIIATPLAPRETLMDDPLRAFRVIRFAARFNFKLHQELHQVMSTLHGNWLPLHKVSVERIGIEVLKMLLGNDPERAFAMLLEYGLLQMVLKPENTKKIECWKRWTPEITKLSLHRLQNVKQIVESNYVHLLGEERAALYVAALLSPLVNFSNMRSTQFESCFTELLRLIRITHRISRLAGHLLFSAYQFIAQMDTLIQLLDAKKQPSESNAASDFSQLVAKFNEILTKDPSTPIELSSSLSMWIRKTRHYWPIAILLSGVIRPNNLGSTGTMLVDLTRERAVVEAIMNSSLKDAVNIMPLLDGFEIMQLLKIPEGRLVGEYAEQLMTWQLRHIGSCTKEKAMEFLVQLHAAKQTEQHTNSSASS